MKNKLNNRGFERNELIVIVGIVGILIIIGVIIGSIIKGSNKGQQGIVLVSYNANGGTGTMETTECKSGSNCTLKNNNFLKEGYDFVGWSTSENDTTVAYKTSDNYKAKEDITLYALWEKKEITIRYNANGGTGTMENTTYTYGDPKISLPKNTFEKTGYNFSGWNIYNPVLDKWYGCTNNSVCSDLANDTLGWHNREEITTYYDNQKDWDTKNSEHDITYYAQWGESTYEIKYELNGGRTGKDSPTSGVYGSTVTIVDPIKEGYIFAGWTVTGTDATLKDKELTIGTSDITLTAQWKTKITNYIEYLYNNASLRTENSLSKDTTKDSNIRYVGSNPKNYVKYNNELWRIIGIFNVSNGTTNSKRIKLVKDTSLLKSSWDSSSSSINNGNGINEWSQADIQKLLNEYYAGNGQQCTYCNNEKQSTCSNNCTNQIKKLDATAKSLIENAVWKLGAMPFDDDPGDKVATVLDAYNMERSTRTGKECSKNRTEGNCTDNVKRTTEWNGLVGLIYVSDYGYATTNNNCFNNITYNTSCASNNWLHKDHRYWTITPRDSTWFANAAYIVTDTQIGDTLTSKTFEIYPSVYLKSDVLIKSGTGSKTDPYILEK